MYDNMDNNGTVRCLFCRRTQERVKKIIVGPDVYICNECINLCKKVIGEGFYNEAVRELTDVSKPQEILSILNEYVIEQERVKRTLSVAAYSHYKRVNQSKTAATQDDVELQKSNIYLIGSIGSGKIFLAQTLVKTLNVPFAIANAASLTEVGYVGEDVKGVLSRLLQPTDCNAECVGKGIIYTDEIDKITRKSENVSIVRDASGESIQQTLLKILGGTVTSVPPQGGHKHPHQGFTRIDTTNALFIVGGAFDGIETIARNRLDEKITGFGKTNSTLDKEESIMQHIIPEDLLKFGLVPEFIGHLPVMVTLGKLASDDLAQILTEPRNTLVKQYQKLSSPDDTRLEFELETLKAITAEAIERNTDARRLRSIIEEVMMNVVFGVPSDESIEKVIIIKMAVEGTGKPAIIYNKKDREAI